MREGCDQGLRATQGRADQNPVRNFLGACQRTNSHRQIPSHLAAHHARWNRAGGAGYVRESIWQRSRELVECLAAIVADGDHVRGHADAEFHFITRMDGGAWRNQRGKLHIIGEALQDDMLAVAGFPFYVDVNIYLVRFTGFKIRQIPGQAQVEGTEPPVQEG